MTPQALTAEIQRKRSYLCVGLDPVLEKLPAGLAGETVAEKFVTFCKAIIEATEPYAVAYKMNLAFFESLGSAGWAALEAVRASIPPECLAIGDGKRGDIGISSDQYAKALFETLDLDATTVSPYMGHDSVVPFLNYAGKWTFVLALTSNPGAADFQLAGEPPLFTRVVNQAESWPRIGQLGYVVGATKADHIADIRRLAPEAFLLVPGIGAQGGDLEGICLHGRSTTGGLLISASRSIIYASASADYAEAAGNAARAEAARMAPYIR